MNKINKILWSAISAVICLVYKSDLRAGIIGCSYSLEGSQQLAITHIDAANAFTLCSQSTLCGTNCTHVWQRDFAEFEDGVEYKQVCAKGQYVSNCGDGYCGGTISCHNCPNATDVSSVVGTTTGVSYMTSYGGAGFSEKTLYVCSNYNPISNTYSSYLTMYKVYVDCSDYNYVHLNYIDDCFIDSGISIQDESGFYEFMNSCRYTE